MKYKCIIFDCDGVLVDSEEISNRVLLEMAKTLGFEIEESHANEFFSGTAFKTILKYIEQNIDGKLPASFESDYRKRTFELFKTELKPIEGIHELLDQISLPVCVASSGPLEKIKINLTTTGLFMKFKDNMFSCYEIGSWKPNPEIFEYAAKKMGFEVNECLVIEDSIPGIRAAKNGGFDVCGYANQRNKKAFEEEDAIVFMKMEELIEIIGIE